MTRNEIIEQTGLPDGGALSTILSDLGETLENNIVQNEVTTHDLFEK